jgi:thioredoxin-like negative regulator of GroEL
MNVIEELKKLAAEATTEHVKALLAAEVEKLEAEAKAATESLVGHLEARLHELEDEVKAKVSGWIASIRKVL